MPSTAPIVAKPECSRAFVKSSAVMSRELKTLTYVALPAWEKTDVARLYTGSLVSDGPGVFSSSSPQPTRAVVSRSVVAADAVARRRRVRMMDSVEGGVRRGGSGRYGGGSVRLDGGRGSHGRGALEATDGTRGASEEERQRHEAQLRRQHVRRARGERQPPRPRRVDERDDDEQHACAQEQAARIPRGLTVDEGARDSEPPGREEDSVLPARTRGQLGGEHLVGDEEARDSQRESRAEAGGQLREHAVEATGRLRAPSLQPEQVAREDAERGDEGQQGVEHLRGEACPGGEVQSVQRVHHPRVERSAARVAGPQERSGPRDAHVGEGMQRARALPGEMDDAPLVTEVVEEEPGVFRRGEALLRQGERLGQVGSPRGLA